MATAICQCQICLSRASGEGQRSKKGRLTIECDEAWSFVGNKGNKQWIWLAFNRDTREIVGVHIGNRSRTGAQALWQSLRQSMVNAPSVTATFGKLMRLSCRLNVIMLSVKTAARLATLSSSTALCGSAYRGWCERRYRFPRSSTIILAQSGILSTITTRPYFFRTTEI